MKLTRNLIVEIEGATFHFRKPDYRTILDLRKKGVEGADYLQTILESCVKVEGVTDEDGKVVPLDTIKEMRLTADAVGKIVQGYNEAMLKLTGGESEEKKVIASV